MQPPMEAKDLRFTMVIAAISGLFMFIFFGFVGTVGWSVASEQCPSGNDCQDAQFAAIFGTSMAAFGLALMVLAIRLAVVSRRD